MQAEPSSQKFAFVIMPFDKEFEGIYNDLIRPALESAQYEVTRADTRLDQENILKVIVQSILRADLVVAELTSLNPNVLYELGLAHGLQKPTVVLTQSMEEVPFDLRSYRVIVYSTRFDEVSGLTDSLREIARKLEEGSITFGNPVTDFAPSVQQEGAAAGLGVPRTEGAQAKQAAGEDEPGILDFMVEVERAGEDISTHLDAMTGDTNVLGQKMEARTAELKPVQGMATPGSALRVHSIARAMASDMTDYAGKLEAELPGFRGSWERLVENATNLLAVGEVRTDEDRKAMIALRSNLQGLQQNTRGAIASTSTAKESLLQLKGTSKDLNHAVRLTMRALDKVIEEFAAAESYVSRMLNLLADRLGADTAGDK